MEKTFIMVKPDGVQRALIGEIIKRLENKGLSLKGLKMVKPDRSVIEKHYAKSSEKPFFEALVEYMISGPIVAMVWEGKDAMVVGRMLIVGGLVVDPLSLKPGTIRGDFAVDIGRKIVHGTVVHGSDTIESAKEEIALWFSEGVVSWESSLQSWIYE